jgi:hypothetical protein
VPLPEAIRRTRPPSRSGPFARFRPRRSKAAPAAESVGCSGRPRRCWPGRDGYRAGDYMAVSFVHHWTRSNVQRLLVGSSASTTWRRHKWNRGFATPSGSRALPAQAHRTAHRGTLR